MIDNSKLLNPNALTSVFGTIPDLTLSDLLEIQLKRDGPTLFVRLMTRQFIKVPPKRWPDKWDVIYLEMSFFGIHALQINNWLNNNVINFFEIVDENGSGFLKIVCDNNSQISCNFDWCKIENIRPGLIGTF